MCVHVSVLLDEAIEHLNIKKNGIYVDATLGGGGHSHEILKRLDKDGLLICFDQDVFAVKQAEEKLKKVGNNFKIINSNFVELKQKLKEIGIDFIDGIIYDLGVSSFQFDIPERGFSYRFDAKLDMRMDQSNDLSAWDIVNTYSYEDISRILYKYGDEKFSRQIAKNIEKSRMIKPINTTFELVNIIKDSLPEKVLRKKGHPAKKTFQALRIAVNDELRVFEKSLLDAINILNKDGMAVVITFHSLEDRICKSIFKDKSTLNYPKDLPIIETEEPILKLVTRKPITSSEEELKNNNRAHSAKLRVAKKNK